MPSSSRSTAALERKLQSLTDREGASLLEDWTFWARPAQVPPEGDWRIWLYLGGRGAGKTRAGAEWVVDGVRTGRAKRVALIATTHSDARMVMIEGESGLLRVSNGAQYEPSNRRILWPGTGAEAVVLSADDPDSIRGYQFDTAWADEFCKWPEPQAALDMILMGLRLGEHPRMAITSTPRAIPALKALTAMKDCVVTHSATRDNAAHLADSFVASMESLYGKSRLGRQELEGEMIEDNDDASWQRDWIESFRAGAAPHCERVVVAVDPPASRNGRCGIVVAGRAGDTGYVLADCSVEAKSPKQWAERVADAYEEFEADCVVAENNQGGDMVIQVLANAHPNMKVKPVHANRGKQLRAEPVATLYETGRVRHAGVFAELEDEMCQYDGSGPSPDRMDALVWALTELFPQSRAAIPKIWVV
ncbi:MAG TPA: terminase family protein [Rhizomicrobium sp.]